MKMLCSKMWTFHNVPFHRYGTVTKERTSVRAQTSSAALKQAGADLVTQPPVKSLKILHAMLRGTRLLNAWVYLYLLLGLAMGV
jgi:hypothetical protein